MIERLLIAVVILIIVAWLVSLIAQGIRKEELEPRESLDKRLKDRLKLYEKGGA